MKKNKYSYLLIVWVFLSGLVTAQEQDSLLMSINADMPFSEIRQKVEEYYADKDKGRGSGYKQWQRTAYLMQNRLLPDGKVANYTAMNLNAYNELVASGMLGGGDDPESANGYWTFTAASSYTTGAGWNGGIGRVSCVAFHPTNANIIYLGTPSGGLWRTTNGGTNWTCLTDGMPSIGVSGIAVNFNNPNIIYILTGDGDGTKWWLNRGATEGIGVLKTTNGGGTWYPTGLSWDINDFIRGFKLRMHPTDVNTLFAATTDGLFKTTDGGATWTQTLTGYVYDFQFKPTDPATMYATRSASATGSTGFRRSTDTGDTWTTITSGIPFSADRMQIGVTPANVNRVYLLAGPATSIGSFRGVFLSTDSGLNFSTQSTTPNILGYDQAGNDIDHQTRYDLAIAVSRTNSTNILTGGINVWSSSNSGVGWTIRSWWNSNNNTIGYTHADIHCIEINPLNSNVYVGSDGGIFRSTDFGATWTDLTSGLGITQWYKIAGTEANSNLIIGGTQDNGSNMWSGGSSIIHLRGADGGGCMIAHDNPDVIYTSRQNGFLEKSIDGGTSFSGATPKDDDGNIIDGPFVTSFVMNPGNANTIYGGYSDGVYKSTDAGSNWTNMGANGSSALAHGVNNTNRVYAANGGAFNMSADAAATWNSYTAPGSVTGITVDPTNSLRVFITVAGFSPGIKVYRSTNGGSSWTNLSGNLPNVPMNCIVYQPGSSDGIYVGTDIGVFYRDNNIGTWVPFMNGLPTVPVFDMVINQTTGVIRAGTYGRGLWTSDLWSACSSNYFLTQGNDPGNPNYTGFQLYEATNTVSSSRIITGGPGTDVTYKAGGSVTLTTGFHAKAGSQFKALLGPCYTSLEPGDGMMKENEEEMNTSFNE